MSAVTESQEPSEVTGEVIENEEYEKDEFDDVSSAMNLQLEDELKECLERCNDGLVCIFATETIPFSGGILSKGKNFHVHNDWHCHEAFLSLATLGPRIVKRMSEMTERIIHSELPDAAKKIGVEMIKMYAIMKKLDILHYLYKSYVVDIGNHNQFGEVISFQRKKVRLFAKLDCVGALWRKYDELKRKQKERERLESAEFN